MSRIAPLILGLPSTELTPSLKKQLQQLNPMGYILFARNIQNEQQVIKLNQELSKLCPLEPLIFIDQEGGRVRRIRWGEFADQPAPAVFGAQYQSDKISALAAAEASAKHYAKLLNDMGFTGNCVPCADLLWPQAHGIIGDRSFGADPKMVAELTAAVIKGTLAGGLWPTIKHAPGHGRALADSHLGLPEVDADIAELMQTDFYPFMQNANCPWVMTAHIKYNALDRQNCVTQSAPALNFMRQKMGMTGLLLGDDLEMQALEGDIPTRLQRALDAGCDVAFWGGTDMQGKGAVTPDYAEKLQSLIDAAPAMREDSVQRFASCRQRPVML